MFLLYLCMYWTDLFRLGQVFEIIDEKSRGETDDGSSEFSYDNANIHDENESLVTDTDITCNGLATNYMKNQR